MDKEILDKIEKQKLEILKICPNAKDQSGIYIYTRKENGFKYAYVGQSLKVLTRLVSHLNGYEQHIDRSLKTHKFKSDGNPCGWEVGVMYLQQDQLNAMEQYYIRLYANAGYQMLNKTSGSQDGDKFGISQNKSGKTYREGIEQGQKTAFKTIKEFFDKYLDYIIKEPCNKVKQRKIKEFEELLKGEQENV